MAFTVRSGSFKYGDYLAKDHILSADYGFGCEGGNKSPHLAWSRAPTGTKSSLSPASIRRHSVRRQAA
jgi:phosphatidylethanolamine-binding protein (PEBP) family uncharacterized protein